MDSKISQKQLFRLAALIYSQADDTFNEQDTFLSMIEGLMLTNENEPVTIGMIASESITQYGFIMTEEEVKACMDQNKDIFLIDDIDGLFHYCLTNKHYKILKQREDCSIEYYISLYIKQNNIIEVDQFRDAIYKFLYELTTTNINSYQIIFNLKCFITDLQESDLSVDSSFFLENERQFISDFLSWDNADKNNAITNIIFCCLEYCLIVSGDRINDITQKFISERHVFIDTNIIYRALGINGKYRQEVIRAFLLKCNQAKINLAVTPFTIREFMDSMIYHVGLAKQYPIRKLYDGAFEDISDYSVYAYYHSWKIDHPTMNDNMFWTMVESSLDKLIDEFHIINEKKHYDIYGKGAQEKIKEYDYLIKKAKASIDKGKDYNYIEEYNKSNADQHDAILIYIAEQKHNEIISSGNGLGCLVVSSDKSLRFWDMNRKKGQPPLVIYPSQLFSLLIKICGRSIEDLKSFISFINIKPTSKQISATQANIILSGISTVTEDINAQKILLSTYVKNNLQNINAFTNNQMLYDDIKAFSEDYFTEELKKRDEQIATANKEVGALKERLSNLEKFYKHSQQESVVEKKRVENSNKKIVEENAGKIRAFAENHIKWKYRRKWFIFPTICAIFSVLVFAFFFFELFFRTWPSNPSVSLIKLYKNTYLGTVVDSSAVFPNTALGALLLSAIAYIFTHIDSVKRFEDKGKMMDGYIKMISGKDVQF